MGEVVISADQVQSLIEATMRKWGIKVTDEELRHSAKYAIYTLSQRLNGQPMTVGVAQMIVALSEVAEHGRCTRASFPLAWELVGFLIGNSDRLTLFDPAVGELRADYARARQYRGKWSRRWLALCFGLRTAVLFVDVVSRCGFSRVTRWVAKVLFLAELYRWWRHS